VSSLNLDSLEGLRIFIVKSSTARTVGDFGLKCLAGESGRLDVICSCIIAAFKLRNGIRRNVLFYAVLEGPPRPPITFEIRGWEVHDVPTSEVEVAKVIRDLLNVDTVCDPRYPGYYKYRMSFRDLVLALKSRGVTPVYLHEGGIDIARAFLPKRVAFIIGDHIGLPVEDERFLDKLGVQRVSLGPRIYLSWFCVALINMYLDGLWVV